MGSKSKSQRLRKARKIRSERLRKYRHRHGVSLNHMIIDRTRVTCEGHSRDSRRIDGKFRLTGMNVCKKLNGQAHKKRDNPTSLSDSASGGILMDRNLQFGVLLGTLSHTRRNPSPYFPMKALHSDELRLIFAYFGATNRRHRRCWLVSIQSISH